MEEEVFTCPKCNSEEGTVTAKAKCLDCGWKGTRDQLISTL